MDKQKIEPIIKAINELLEANDNSTILVAIEGRCASGKTTLGKYLYDNYPCSLFHMDDFFLQPNQRTRERLEEIGGNVDYERFKREIIEPLLQKESVYYQPYSCRENVLLEKRKISFQKLNIIEGAYSTHPYFNHPYQCKIFLDIEEETQRKNILKRNGIEELKQFEEKWIPKENIYFEKLEINDYIYLTLI